VRQSGIRPGGSVPVAVTAADGEASVCWPPAPGPARGRRAARHEGREDLWPKAKMFSGSLAPGPGRATVPRPAPLPSPAVQTITAFTTTSARPSTPSTPRTGGNHVGVPVPIGVNTRNCHTRSPRCRDGTAAQPLGPPRQVAGCDGWQIMGEPLGGPTSMARAAPALCHPRRPAQVRGTLPGRHGCRGTVATAFGLDAGRAGRRLGYGASTGRVRHL
jgi:hypothetical protein